MVVLGSAWQAASWTSRRGDAGVERGGDEGVPQGVWADRLGDAGASGGALDDAAGAVPVEALAVGAGEHRPDASAGQGSLLTAWSAILGVHQCFGRGVLVRDGGSASYFLSFRVKTSRPHSCPPPSLKNNWNS